MKEKTKKKMKTFLDNNPWLKLIPNFLTICNSLCGFSAILYTLHVYDEPKQQSAVLAISAWIILGAMVFDALDGFTARILNATSMHGAQMDSLADMVTFGVAPATIVAIMAHHLRDLESYQYIVVWLMSAIYIACAALRLATYNVHAILEKKSDGKFSGLPSPGAAAAICSIIIYYNYAMQNNNNSEFILKGLPIYTAFMGLMMVAPVKYVHAGKWLQSVRRNKKRLALLILIIISLILYPQLSTVLIINLYIISGPIGTLYSKYIKK